LHILAGRLDLPTPDHFASGEHRALAGTPFEAALHPQPARRYANASTFVDDLLDWLAEITSEIAWPLPHEMPPEPPGTTEQEWVWSPLLQPRLGNKQTLYHNKENTRVSSCIWLNDQDTFLSAGEDGFIYRWGLGEPEPTFVAATDVPILSLAISQDGWHLATGHADGSVRVWQQDGLLLHELAPHTGPVYACSLAANGQILATGGADGTLRVWDLRAERQLTVFRTYTGAIRCCTLNPSGSLVLFGGDDQRLQLGGVANGDILQTFKGHLQAVLGCDLRGELAFSGDAGGNLYAWDILLEDPPLALREHRGAVADCHIYEGADGSVYGLSCATDGQVCTWDLRTGTLREVARPFPQEAVSLTACALNARARVVGTADGRLHIQARGGQVLAARRTGQHTSGIVAVAAHDNDAYAIGYDSRLTHSRRADGALQAVFALEAIPTVLAIDADYIYAGDQEGRLRCYDRHRGRLRWEAKAHRGAVTFILAEPADAIITGGADGVLAQWKKQDGARLSARSVAPVGLHCAALQDDTRLLAGTQSGDVLRINFRSGHSLEPVLALGQPIRAILRFGPMWFAGTSDGYLQALNTDAEHTGWRLHASGLQALAIIPGPKWLSSLSPQGELAVWDMAAQRCLHRWQPGPLFGAMASAGHHQLLLGDEAGHLHLLYWGPTHG
ncbi:MAG: WD40 repeat domain-containing protein, partial [Anaerolineales bacterium]